MSGGSSHPLSDELVRQLLAALSALGRAMSVPYEPRSFLADFSDAVQAFLPHDRMALFVFGEDLTTYSVFAEHVGAREGVHEQSFTQGSDAATRSAVQPWALEYVREGRVIRIDDIEDEPRLAAVDAPERRLSAMGFRSLLAQPFHSAGAVVGSLSVRSLRPHAFDEVLQQRLAILVELAAPFFVSAIVRMRERWRRERLTKIESLSRALASKLDSRESFPLFAERLRPLLDYDHLGIGLLTANGADVEMFASTSGPHASSKSTKVPALEYSFDDRLRAGQVVVLRDAPAELVPGYVGDDMLRARGLRSMMFAPIVLGDRTAGAILIGKAERSWYDDADAEFARVVAFHLSFVLQHDRLATEERRRRETELQRKSLEQRIETLQSELHDRWGFDAIVGRSRPLRAAITDARKVAATDTTVLITGESGTGKELFARAIHVEGPRRDGPFLALNCAALPEHLMESELFGHEKGAFTGADRARVGRFESAGGGTLFLDEVAELAPGVQAKLLRVLQEREYSPLGSSRVVKADVRVVAATNRELRREVAAGRFRDDLYYRLSVFTVTLPPLRAREDDVLLLAEYLVRTLSQRMARPTPSLTREARAALLTYPWPGNIRELSNTLERALIVGDGRTLDVAQLGLDFQPAIRPATASTVTPADPTSLSDLERRAVESALESARWNRSKAAKILGVTRSQLYTRMKRFGLE